VSYETSRYGQGVLTYSLLLGIRGPALQEDLNVDIATLFNFAGDKVPELARDIGGIQRPVIASPSGGRSFPIGQVNSEDRKKIALQLVRPLVLRTNFQEEVRVRDRLGLTKKVNEHLRELSANSRGSGLVFVDATELPGGYEVAGRYRLSGDKVTIAVTVFQGEKDIKTLEVQGEKTKLEELVTRLVSEVEKALPKEENR
jgi:hypothetical protein